MLCKSMGMSLELENEKKVTFYEYGGCWATYDDVHGLTINGHLIPSKDYSSPTPCLTFSNKPVTVEKITHRQVQVGVTRNGEAIDWEEYQAVLSELMKEFDSDACVYSSIDAEYAVKKHREGIAPIMERETTVVPYSISIVPLAVDSDVPPYCAPARLMDMPTTGKAATLWHYKANKLKLVEAEGQSFGVVFKGVDDSGWGPSPKLEWNEWNVPSHSAKDLKFLKLGENFTDYDTLLGIKSCTGTIDECRDAHKHNVELIRRFWAHEVSKLSRTKLDTKQAGELYALATSAQKSLRTVAVGKKHESAYNQACGTLRKVVDELARIIQGSE